MTEEHNEKNPEPEKKPLPENKGNMRFRSIVDEIFDFLGPCPEVPPQKPMTRKEQADHDYLKHGILERGPGYEVREHPTKRGYEVVYTRDSRGKNRSYRRRRREYLCDLVCDIDEIF